MAKVTQQRGSREGAQNQISWTPKPFPSACLGVSSSLHIPHTAGVSTHLGYFLHWLQTKQALVWELVTAEGAESYLSQAGLCLLGQISGSWETHGELA